MTRGDQMQGNDEWSFVPDAETIELSMLPVGRSGKPGSSDEASSA